ncbi:insulin-induced protein-domain-containing protein [Leptodontidium sp. MPI-SDFR-AT-0119]|nr:insulin-induced protein-domain-containing protein [Leptodontidium sp. MPI-SDFR-AT-0119]
MSSSQPQIYRPKPRRPFAPFDQSSEPNQPPSPQLAPSEPPSRTHSFLNLTSSTLLGIYSPTGYQADDLSSTPWGTGALTPRTPSISDPVSSRPRTKSQAHLLPPQSASSSIFALGLRSILLFGMGMGYGVLVRHLHDDRQLAPFQVEGIIKPRNDWRYLVFWGVAGVLLGSLMPWVDTLFLDSREEAAPISGDGEGREEGGESGIFGADWTPVVRSVGAFVGIAYAIRKLPWASTLQASLTLALVNPVLWYLIDRSKPGFLLSSFVGATGTALLLASNPDMMPSPASASVPKTTKNSTSSKYLGTLGGELGLGGVRRETIEGGIWILSVLFCSCVCFGNIGRR